MPPKYTNDRRPPETVLKLNMPPFDHHDDYLASYREVKSLRINREDSLEKIDYLYRRVINPPNSPSLSKNQISARFEDFSSMGNNYYSSSCLRDNSNSPDATSKAKNKSLPAIRPLQRSKTFHTYNSELPKLCIFPTSTPERMVTTAETSQKIPKIHQHFGGSSYILSKQRTSLTLVHNSKPIGWIPRTVIDLSTPYPFQRAVSEKTIRKITKRVEEQMRHLNNYQNKSKGLRSNDAAKSE